MKKIMKKIFTLTLILFIGVLGFSQNKKAVITFEKTVIDYGTIDKGANGVKDFVFTNTGDAPLIISNVKSSLDSFFKFSSSKLKTRFAVVLSIKSPFDGRFKLEPTSDSFNNFIAFLDLISFIEKISTFFGSLINSC